MESTFEHGSVWGIYICHSVFLGISSPSLIYNIYLSVGVYGELTFKCGSVWRAESVRLWESSVLIYLSLISEVGWHGWEHLESTQVYNMKI